MKIVRYIILILFAIAAYFIISWAYPIVKDRYFTPDEEEKKETSQQEEVKEEEKKEEETQTEETSTEEQSEESDPSDVTSDDCKNECSRFAEGENKKYCRQVCGLDAAEESSDCDSLSGIDKDYCLKDSAISNKDFGKCDQISDSKIKDVCRNRITEEILDEY